MAIGEKDFSKKVIKALAKKGIAIMGITVIPDNSSPMPWASGNRGYMVNDNDCGRVWTYQDVLFAAGVEQR